MMEVFRSEGNFSQSSGVSGVGGGGGGTAIIGNSPISQSILNHLSNFTYISLEPGIFPFHYVEPGKRI